MVAVGQYRTALIIAKDQYAASYVTFRWLDVTNVPDADLGTFGLVIAVSLSLSLSLSLCCHLANQESVLSLLLDAVDDDCLLVHSWDDRQHLYYPPNEKMDWLVMFTDDSLEHRHCGRIGS
ncbi:hypothetical protein ACFOUR_16715 [Halovivax cerinus]|uniref:Uncharacterized protein n=1 Tax=Halovivax cerinus TaxID=1487865 RepID=A0ABD5NSM2_9EURY